MRVLIAEDAMTSRIVLEEWVATWGYEPVSVPDGLAAWHILQADDAPRLILLDWMMPNMDGLELCKKVKQEQSHTSTYIILLTSKNSKEDIVTGLDAGADDFISKPVQPEELRSRLNVGSRILGYQQRLLELDEQKNKFLGMAAHDLRNPLSSILGFSQLLLNTAMDEEGRKEFLTIINQVSEEMLVTLNDLLDISVIESGKFDLNKQANNFSDLVHYRVRLNSMRAQQKQIHIDTYVPNELNLNYDQERIGQVLDNLLSNAIKYSPPQTSIQVFAEVRDDGYLFLSVKDQGPGIPAAKKDRLFGTFEKLGVKPTGGEKSTGLGLAIVKKIILAHDGEVGVETEEGKGSCFFFSLPYYAEISPEESS